MADLRRANSAQRRRLSSDYSASQNRLGARYRVARASFAPALREFGDVARRVSRTLDLLHDPATAALRDAISSALLDFAPIITREANRMQASGIRASLDLAATSLEAIGITRYSRPALQALVNYVDSPSFRLGIARYAPYHTQHVQDIIVNGMNAGKSPVATARMVASYTDFPLADAERTVRTVQLWSARRGMQETFQANSDVVVGWLWSASLDANVCLSCVSMQGTFHDVTEILDDHYNGRCAMVPVTREMTGRSGQEWFDNLPVPQQESMMGPARYAAYQDGAFEFSQLSTTYQDDVYGQMRREASLNELVGSNTAGAYKRPAA